LNQSPKLPRLPKLAEAKCEKPTLARPRKVGFIANSTHGRVFAVREISQLFYMQRSRPLSLVICPRQFPAFFSDVSRQRLSFFWQDALNLLPSMRMSRQVRE
jgi:hypothetical protein